MAAPTFIDTDEQAIIARLVSNYEAQTGRTLQPAQAERLIINMVAYEMRIVREQMQAASEQMLIRFAGAPALDYLVELLGVTRLPAAPATVVLRFTASTGHPGALMPAGTRVATDDGQVIFATTQELTIASGTLTGDVAAVATTLGVAGNAYPTGAVNRILDPRAYITTAASLAATAGGADAESDAELRERALLAPSSFSVAGSVNAYKYHARQVSADIVDVAVISPSPGLVRVYPLTAAGTPSSGLIAQVLAALSADDVRPLTDTVEVLAPTAVDYDIEARITAYTNADPDTVEAAALEAVTAYAALRSGQVGQDVKRSQLTALCVGADGLVFDVALDEPAADVVVGASGFARLGNISVTVTGSSNG